VSLLLAAGGATPTPSWIIGWKQPTSDFSPHYWIDRNNQSFDPFFSRTVVAPKFFVLYQERQNRLEAEGFTLRTEGRFPFVQRPHSPIFEPPRSTWNNWQTDEAKREAIEFQRVFFAQNGLSVQARLEGRRLDWEIPWRNNEPTRFPFTTAAAVVTPFFVYQDNRRAWDWVDQTPIQTKEQVFTFVQNGLNVTLQVEKWHRIEAEGLPRQCDPWGDFLPFYKPPTGWTSAFNVESGSGIEAEKFRRISDDGWADFRPFWIQPDQPIPQSPDQSTPGRITRKDWWKPKEEPAQATKPGRIKEYEHESARIGQQLSQAKAESTRLRQEISRLEAELEADGIRRLAEQRALEHALLLAQQAAILVAVQEAVLLEEMEVIDIAFIAAVVVLQTQ
jgi:hypothetical protein